MAAALPFPQRQVAPSLLAVTSEMPWPLDSGGHLRTFHLLRALARHFDVRLVTAAGASDGVGALRRAGVSVHAVDLSPRRWYREALRAAANGAAGKPYVLYGRHDQPAVRRAVRDEIARQRPALLYLDHLDSLVFAEEARGVPIVADLHNVYSTLVERTAEESCRGLRQRYLKREARLLDAMERRAARLATTMLASSQGDCDHFAALGARSVHLVPNGVDCSAYGALPEGRHGRDPLLLYVGTMSWEPNARAAVFLADVVLPRVRAEFPGCRLRIVGRDPTPDVQALSARPGVEVTGRVAAMEPHLVDASLLTVPLESGGGTRLKILEAFAAGLPVVSTPVGCEGIDGIAGTHLLVADRLDFAEEVCRGLRDAGALARVAASARRLALDKYDWGAVGQLASAAARHAAAGR